MIDYLKQGRTMNGAYYAGDLRRLRQKITRKRQGKLTRGVLLLQDNAPAHTLQVVMRERRGSVVECLTRDRRAAGWSFTGVTALWSLSKTHLS